MSAVGLALFAHLRQAVNMARKPATLAIACLLALAVAAPSAQATFAGRPGLVASGQRDGLHVANPDGTGERVAGDLTNVSGPAWSHDGRRVAVSAETPDADTDTVNYDIYVVDVATGESRQLTHGAAGDYVPTWGRGDRSIVFQRVRPLTNGSTDLTKRLFRIRLSGGRARYIGVKSPYMGGSEVAPGGRKIAFVSDGDVFLTGRNGHGTHRIVDFPGGDGQRIAGSVSWAPDGRSLAILATFNSPCEECAEVWTVDRDGSNLRKLTPEQSGYGKAFFSPRGNKIASCRTTWKPDNTAQVSTLLLMNLSGSHQKALGSFCGTAWQALP
jgi:Tol biopolymer transport system component